MVTTPCRDYFIPHWDSAVGTAELSFVGSTQLIRRPRSVARGARRDIPRAHCTQDDGIRDGARGWGRVRGRRTKVGRVERAAGSAFATQTWQRLPALSYSTGATTPPAPSIYTVCVCVRVCGCVRACMYMSALCAWPRANSAKERDREPGTRWLKKSSGTFPRELFARRGFTRRSRCRCRVSMRDRRSFTYVRACFCGSAHLRSRSLNFSARLGRRPAAMCYVVRVPPHVSSSACTLRASTRSLRSIFWS